MDEQKETLDAVRVRVNYPDPSPDMVEFSNQLTIHHEKHEFVLTFYRVVPPQTFGKSQDEVRAMGTLDAVPVASIIVPASRIKSFAKALWENVEHYENNFGPLDGGEEDEA